MKNVRIIPAKPKENNKLRVAAYCRVSTSGPEQIRSLEIQISAYTKMIKNHPNWLFAGVFFDIESGLRRSGRKNLDKLLKKAAKGKIDYIITKSISRVSRDTLEILKIIRFLRERGINMHFENEKLDSIEADKEFEITLRGMLAQDESRNISENIQWGIQRKFEKGEIYTKYKNFMGYTCVDGEIVIVPEQAEVVRKIFDLYLHGLTLGQIKAYLESQEIKTVTGKEIWDTKTIQRILTNEKYKGDTMLQKTFTEDFMTGKKRKNGGQRNKYYVKDSHPAIVSAKVFDKVQEEMAKRSMLVRKEDGTAEISGSKYNGKYLLGNLLMCGECGASYRRRTERGKVVWRCATRIEKGKDACLTYYRAIGQENKFPSKLRNYFTPNPILTPSPDRNTASLRELLDHKKFTLYFSGLRKVYTDLWTTIGQIFEANGITQNKFTTYIIELNAGRTDADHYSPSELKAPNAWDIDDETMQRFCLAKKKFEEISL